MLLWIRSRAYLGGKFFILQLQLTDSSRVLQHRVHKIKAHNLTTRAFQCDSVDGFVLSITSLNALATLLEVLLIFSFANRHTDTKALLYPFCARARGVMSKLKLVMEHWNQDLNFPLFCASVDEGCGFLLDTINGNEWWPPFCQVKVP